MIHHLEGIIGSVLEVLVTVGNRNGFSFTRLADGGTARSTAFQSPTLDGLTFGRRLLREKDGIRLDLSSLVWFDCLTLALALVVVELLLLWIDVFIITTR